MPLRLTLFLPDRPGVQALLADGRRYRIGRDTAVELPVDDARISREHLVLDGTGEYWRACDLGSKNGTRLDGMPIATVELRRRGWLSIGGVPALIEPVSGQESRAGRTLTDRRRLGVARELKSMVSGAAPDALLMRALETTRRIADCQRSGFWLCDADGTLRAERVIGLQEPKPSSGVMQQVATTGTPVFCSDTDGAAAIARHESVAEGGLRAIVALPLRAAGTVVGVLYADSLRPGKVFTQLDAELLAAVADQLALTLRAADMRAAVAR